MIVSEQFVSLGQRRQSAIIRAMQNLLGPADPPWADGAASTPGSQALPCRVSFRGLGHH
jgi:hypothetical protein